MVSDKAKQLVAQMTLEEKASLLSGKDFWKLKAVERLGLKSIMVTDGPHGLRKQAGNSDHLGLNQSVPATCFPTASATACSFDRDLMTEIGAALGEMCLQEDVAVLLGPAVNIKRSPLCGRNFEYVSEDPYLTGEMSAAIITGIQSQGVGTSLKHFAANNQEQWRMVSDSVVDERALREIYLAGFEAAVKQSQPWTVMCAYNKLNGTFCSENDALLNKILRDEWGFEGLVVTDWGAVNDRVRGVFAGLDLEMPSSGGENDALIVEAVKEGRLLESVVDEAAQRVVALILKHQENSRPEYRCDLESHHRLAQKAAAESAVLLKNDGGLLPADKSKKAAVIGAFARTPRYQGAGSSKINPVRLDCAWDEFVAQGANVVFAAGYDLSTKAVKQELIAEACAAAAGKDIVYLFVGLPDAYESEGFDRTSLGLPQSHNLLVEEVCKVNPNVVVILLGGSPVALPWADQVPAILLTYLGGEACGSASVDLLLGKAVPCGKLAETFPLVLEDVPSFNYFPGTALTVEYRESIFVGYRYYETARKAVRFPFGYGLSYTEFEYSNIRADRAQINETDPVRVTCTVKNVGLRAGKEIVQLYITHKDPTIYKAVKELKDFVKIALAPGESKEISFVLGRRAFAYYNVNIKDWHVESGEYQILIGASSQDIRLRADLTVRSTMDAAVPDYRTAAPIYYNLPGSILQVEGEQFTAVYGKPLPPAVRPKDEPFDLNATLNDIKETLVGKLVLRSFSRSMSGMAGDDPEMKAMLSAMMMDLPFRAIGLFSGGKFSQSKIQALIDLANGKWLPGLLKLVKK